MKNEKNQKNASMGRKLPGKGGPGMKKKKSETDQYDACGSHGTDTDGRMWFLV